MNSITDDVRSKVLTYIYQLTEDKPNIPFTFDEMYNSVYWAIRSDGHKMYWKTIYWAVEDIMGAGYFITCHVETTARKVGGGSSTITWYTLRKDDTDEQDSN